MRTKKIEMMDNGLLWWLKTCGENNGRREIYTGMLSDESGKNDAIKSRPKMKKLELPTNQMRAMKSVRGPLFFGMFSQKSGETCSADPETVPWILVSNCYVLRTINPRKSSICGDKSSNSPATSTCYWNQLCNSWLSMRSPNRQVNADNPWGPSSHYTTRTGGDKRQDTRSRSLNTGL